MHSGVALSSPPSESVINTISQSLISSQNLSKNISRNHHQFNQSLHHSPLPPKSLTPWRHSTQFLVRHPHTSSSCTFTSTSRRVQERLYPFFLSGRQVAQAFSAMERRTNLKNKPLIILGSLHHSYHLIPISSSILTNSSDYCGTQNRMIAYPRQQIGPAKKNPGHHTISLGGHANIILTRLRIAVTPGSPMLCN